MFRHRQLRKGRGGKRRGLYVTGMVELRHSRDERKIGSVGGQGEGGHCVLWFEWRVYLGLHGVPDA